MLISSALAAAAALLATQADKTRGPREAFTACLFAYADKSAQDRVSQADFDTRFAQQCQAEEKAYLDSLRAREVSMKTPAKDIDELVKGEIDYARENSKGRFIDAAAPK